MPIVKENHSSSRRVFINKKKSDFVPCPPLYVYEKEKNRIENLSSYTPPPA